MKRLKFCDQLQKLGYKIRYGPLRGPELIRDLRNLADRAREPVVGKMIASDLLARIRGVLRSSDEERVFDDLTEVVAEFNTPIMAMAEEEAKVLGFGEILHKIADGATEGGDYKTVGDMMNVYDTLLNVAKLEKAGVEKYCFTHAETVTSTPSFAAFVEATITGAKERWQALVYAGFHVGGAKGSVGEAVYRLLMSLKGPSMIGRTKLLQRTSPRPVELCRMGKLRCTTIKKSLTDLYPDLYPAEGGKVTGNSTLRKVWVAKNFWDEFLKREYDKRPLHPHGSNVR